MSFISLTVGSGCVCVCVCVCVCARARARVCVCVPFLISVRLLLRFVLIRAVPFVVSFFRVLFNVCMGMGARARACVCMRERARERERERERERVCVCFPVLIPVRFVLCLVLIRTLLRAHVFPFLFLCF